LSSQKKEDIELIIKNYRDIDNDIINAKGGGIIFLLHGPPGVGKTLTAEATSETLKKPLYSVNVGELGTDLEKLEYRLKNILEICYAWDAVLLLDEADIFLEKRNDNDIQRNAMVGVFLRLLE
jgi:SpoVK/Ycf46/Vps4 family AAA+-type ATPase